VRGLRLADGREVVVKVRPRLARLAGCAVVHRALWTAGYPCPDAYQHARGRRWTSADYAACWAAGLWQRAFDAKTRSLHGDPGQILTRHEAGSRLRLAGLNPGLATDDVSR
jgi:hypothetical protein